jgi:hypothetical protein
MEMAIVNVTAGGGTGLTGRLSGLGAEAAVGRVDIAHSYDR